MKTRTHQPHPRRKAGTMELHYRSSLYQEALDTGRVCLDIPTEPQARWEAWRAWQTAVIEMDRLHAALVDRTILELFS
ncbi:MAG: hypothetical protein WCP31_07705 [Chloroflexales bacterium]